MRFEIHRSENLRRASRRVEFAFGILESEIGSGDFVIAGKTLFGDGCRGAFKDAAGLNAGL